MCARAFGSESPSSSAIKDEMIISFLSLSWRKEAAAGAAVDTITISEYTCNNDRWNEGGEA